MCAADQVLLSHHSSSGPASRSRPCRLVMSLALLMLFLAMSLLAQGYQFFHPDFRLTSPHQVWHHQQTIAVLSISQTDNQPRIVGCELILVEGRDERQKSKLLADLSQTSGGFVQETDFPTMLNLVQICKDLDDGAPRGHSGVKESNKKKAPPTVNMWTLLKGIVPGTKWCGVNDIANGYHDLGADWELDKCCRAHDHCPIKVKPFSTNYGAKNNHFYTKSHCDCDDLFYRCLKVAATSSGGSNSAQTIGRLYFNVLRLQCSRPRYPKVCLDPATSSYESHQNNTTSTKRLFFTIPSSAAARKNGTGLANNCVHWIEDTDAFPTLDFVQPERQF